MSSNEEFVRRAYDIAEQKDIPGWIDCFNPDGLFIDNSAGITYRAPDEVAKPVENYGRAFSNMHRELYDIYAEGDMWPSSSHSKEPMTALFRCL